MLEHTTRELLSKLPVALVVFEPPGVLRWLNPRAQALLDLPLEELIDRLVYDIVHPDDRKQAAERVGALLYQEPLPSGRYRILRANGSILHLEVESCVSDIDGVTYIVTALREVTPESS